MNTDTDIHDRIAADDHELLDALAEHGGRLAVLRQLDAGFDAGEMDARGIARATDLPADASVGEIAEVFVDAWSRWYEAVMCDTGDHVSWTLRVEERYGHEADEILERAGRDAEVRHQ